MEGSDEADNENGGDKGLGDGGSPQDNPGNGEARSGNPSESRTEYPLINIFRLDKADEETLKKIQEAIKESNAGAMKSPAKNGLDLEGDLSKDIWVTVSERREIFPKLDEKTEKIHKLPEFRCCSVEHNYCQIKKSGLGTRAFKVRKSSRLNEQGKNACSKEQSKNTSIFENGSGSGKKRMEEQTIVAKDSITKHVDPGTNLDKTNEVNERLKGISVSRIIASSSQQIGHVANVTGDNENQNTVRSSTPIIAIRRSSIGSGDCYGIILQNAMSSPPPLVAIQPNSGQGKDLGNDLEKRNTDARSKRKSESRKRGPHQDEFIYKVVKMDDITHQRSAALSNAGELNTVKLDARNTEGVPIKIRRLSGRDVSETPKEEGGYVLAKSNLTKTVPGDKNWNMEYTEDAVRNLGLDDLLLRASELNAENFTKALGRNSGGRNSNKPDSPEGLLSTPRSKRECDEPLDGDNAKRENIKKAKLEFLKKCVTDDKVMEESLKKIPEFPKKPGLKVKTVQNINAEFKDSLGAKKKRLEGQDILSQSTIPVYTIDDDAQLSNRTKGILVPVGRGRVPVTQPVRLTCRKVNRQQSPIKKVNEMSEETRPFIMTIVPNKNSPTKSAPTKTAAPQMPARLTPKVFIKPKTVIQQRGKLLAGVEERPREATISNAAKGAAGACSKSGENVTVVVSEPRSFELVSLGDYSQGSVKKGASSHYVVNCGSLAKKDVSGKNVMQPPMGGGVRKKNIPIVIGNKTKYLQVPLAGNQKLLLSPAKDASQRIRTAPRPQSSVVTISQQGAANIQGQRNPAQKAHFTVSPIKQRVQPKNVVSGTGVRKYVQVIPNMVSTRAVRVRQNATSAVTTPDFHGEAPVPRPKSQMMSLTAFANLLKDIIPEKWILSLDKKFGLQMIKIHLDECLNPSIMVSVVVGRSGKVTVNVRGRQLERSHDLFSNLCDMSNSNKKVSINYILGIINKLKFYNVCYGCDDLTLKKYWGEDGFIEYYTEFQQTFRSHICENLVRLGRKRCHPCYRMHESLKKRRRREQLAQKREMEAKAAENAGESCLLTNTFQGRGTKRNMEEYIEEAFTRMKQRITEEIDRLKAEEESERVPQTQDEVLGFIGLTRKESLDVTVRKSKRERKGSKKCESLLASDVNKEELYFLEKYWHEITVLFSTSLLVGAYSRTSMGKLKEKCKTFYKLLAMWRDIIRDNAIWIGGYMNLAENLVNEAEMTDPDSVTNKFERMDVPALRAYIINCVKEVNRMKNRLRTKNTYFRLLYDTFLKPNMKKARQGTESVGSPRINMNLAAEKEPEQEVQDEEEITPDKFLELKLSTPPEFESSDDNGPHNGAAPTAPQERVIIYV